MYRYFLGAFGNKSFIRPQYEIMEDGKLRGIEDRWGEFPNGGTVSLTGISDSDTESIKNRLLQFKIDFNRDLHPGYAPYTDNSNKYQIPFNAIDDFDKVQIQVGEVIKCEPVPKAKKLLVSQIKIGAETRQIVSGIAKYYKPEEMVGKKVAVITNLKPCKLCGVESQGMILAAGDDEGNLSVVTVDKDIVSGSEIC